MANRYKVTLTQKEREQLTELARGSKSTAAKFVHARALLLCDAGKYGDPWKVVDVASALGVTSRTVEHLKQRFIEEGWEAALARKPQRKRRETIFDGEFDARLTALACSRAPAGYQRWTVRLLADRLIELKIVDSISTMTVQRSLKKTNCVLT
jgi:transposase